MRYYFMSWIVFNGRAWFLTDREVFSERGREIFKDCSPEYVLGHEAIRKYFRLEPDAGEKYANTFFWQTKNFPSEMVEKLADFDKNFGRIFNECFWYYNYYYTLENPYAPEEWRERAWQKLLENEKGDFLFHNVIAIKVDYDMSEKWKERAWREMLRRGIKRDYTLEYLRTNAPQPWSERAKALLEKQLKKARRNESGKKPS